MSSEYSYDEEGQFFPFFVLTLTSLVTLPLTWTVLSPSKDPDANAKRGKAASAFEAEHGITEVKSQRLAQRRKMRRVKRTLFIIVGWAIMGLMAYLIVVTKTITPKLWNPYDILEIPDSSSEKEIKSKYRRLSLKYHPDKVKIDESKNETMEILNARYVEITKAYQALTDEDVRNNYIQYGHPDGKQSMSFGIALPKFIISDGNGKYVVLFYTLVLGVLLPYLVGSWWYGIQRSSKEGVLIESANNLFREYKEDLDESGIVTALSTAKEYKLLLKGDKTDSGLAKVESKISDIVPAAEKAKLEELDDSVRRKALALLWAYLGRVDLDDDALNKAKFQVGPIAQSLIRSFTAISLAYGNAAPIIASYIANQHIVQAMLPKSSPLLQLPFFTPAVVAAVDGDSKIHATVQQFMDIPETQRRQLVTGKGLLSDDQYTKAMSVAREIPHLRVAKAFFKVPGERFITPSSLVSLVVKGRVIPPGSENIPAIDPLDLEDMDPAEDDLEAITGRKKKVKGADGRWVAVEEKIVNPTLTTAPYFARDHLPKWFVFLTDAKSGKVAVPPFPFTQFEEDIFDAESKPTFNMQTFKAQFAAPPQPGNYTFAMHLICDSYVGLDTKMEVTLVVEEASKAAQMAAEDEISDPEEDSIAGQMTALRGGQVKRSPVTAESDDESGTDEEEDDTSDTNTDTEDES
ncbi:related to translocation protein SEC63 [Cephalotrichum gorgonifer]|uniref:Related to translocation protein SEC63 n=1 Tax=Cephalotrichum gorgonifer TaxID=2041049 RepID=A0AAE8MVH3_9PEZI|nr:related to translocation protein SEC63 [Cephalotrichum gorgonifer]